MRNKEHCERFLAGDYSPRIVEAHAREGHLLFIAWTPWREGKARPDHAAALADLRDMIAAREHESLLAARFADWQYDVANGDTRLGFEDWCKHNKESDET